MVSAEMLTFFILAWGTEAAFGLAANLCDWLAADCLIFNQIGLSLAISAYTSVSRTPPPSPSFRLSPFLSSLLSERG